MGSLVEANTQPDLPLPSERESAECCGDGGHVYKSPETQYGA